MMLFGVGVELPNFVAVDGLKDGGVREEHRRMANRSGTGGLWPCAFLGVILITDD
jgi:hypothetical protein